MAQINLVRLAGEQMHGYGVARESIHRQEIQLFAGKALQHQTAVAQKYVFVRGTGLKEIEHFAVNLRHKGVDLVVVKRIARASQRRRHTSAQSENSNTD